MRIDLPSGTVTFLFTDVEGSTRLLHELGAAGYAGALGEHRRVVRGAFNAHDGVEVDTQGDAFFVAFPTAPGALAAAAAALNGLAGGPITVRIGLHTGTPLLTEEGYVGEDVHRAARIAACGHGGQVLVSTSAAALVDSDMLHDLGEHRLKDLSAPERIYQLGDREFPALKSLYRTNLPIPATPFLGRERELTEVVALLHRDDVRLLTMTGPGGTGKTRLALQAAAEASEAYPDGVFWVPLAPLRDPALVLEEASRAVGANDGLAEHIADKHLLLLLDNFEHLVEAAADVAAVLGVCPNLRLIVTSREPLHLTGEQEYPVLPLIPAEGVEFFCARARAIKPDFVADDAVPRICSRLDDLPLALELAAARIKALSPAQILERLEQRLPLLTGGAKDLPERQRTLRATIEWSHDLLTDDEQRLFARLAVFRGGCTLEAAEDICDADLDTLQSLVDKSLLRHNQERYWMLETIREHATQKLEEADEPGDLRDLRDRHAAHFLALAEEAEPHIERNAEVGRRLEDAHANLRAALDHLVSSGDSQPALRLAGALASFWESGHVKEGRQRLETLLASDERPTAARAKALTGAAVLARQSNDAASTRRRAAEALALYRDLGDSRGIAWSTLLLGLATADDGNFSDARQIFEDCVQLFRDAGDDGNELFASRLLGWMYTELGDDERARQLHEDDLERARALGDKPMEGQTLTALAYLALKHGRAADAMSMYEDALRIDRDQGSLLQMSFDLCRFARALAIIGDAPERAASLLAAAEAIREEIGAGAPRFLAKIVEETLVGIRTELDDATFAAAWEQGKALNAAEAVALALGESLGA